MGEGDDISALSTLAMPIGPAEAAPARPRRDLGVAGQRYEDMGLIGVGGMGEVRRVLDTDLNRVMAMKVIRHELLGDDEALGRFIEEAQATAQLEHPSIVPVHELGRLADGRFFFTMKEVRGRTLGDVIDEVDRSGAPGARWTFRRLMDAFVKVCDAVAYAHARGVVHRDLKPDNVMVGEFGEVLVVDWGLARVTGRRDFAAEAGDLDVVVTDGSGLGHRPEAIEGTPAYMPPEQARGDVASIDARSDVYALGAILYQLLCGRPPYEGDSALAVLEAVLAGPPPPPGEPARREEPQLAFTFASPDTPSFDADAEAAPPPSLPAHRASPSELIEICTRAMARTPADRYPDARTMATELTLWLDGARRRERAMSVLDEASRKAPEARALRQQAETMRQKADALLADVPAWAPETDKAPAWAQQDAADALEQSAELKELEAEGLLRAALTHAPELSEAHAALAERYRADHADAEARRDHRAARRAEARLREHAWALPDGHLDRARHLDYLQGDGKLTLVTDPPEARVLLHRYALKNRRLVPVFERALDPTPLSGVRLPMGSYLLRLEHPDRVPVDYPIHIRRGEHWSGARPGADWPHPIYLPRPGELGEGDVYVPAGWFHSGDRKAAEALDQRRVWVDGFVITRFPVTNADYMAFLDAQVAGGAGDDVLDWVPRERAGTIERRGAMVYGRRDDGTFTLRPDSDGVLWEPDWPVLLVDWPSAATYARWLAASTGLPWRLPAELEWEKAARGVDGRLYPWGDRVDPSWCCIRDSHQGRQLPSPVDSFPVDASPYGVRGMAGNARDWCHDLHTERGSVQPDGVARRPSPSLQPDTSPEALRVSRGGGWFNQARHARTPLRGSYPPGYRLHNLGFRLARPFPV